MDTKEAAAGRTGDNEDSEDGEEDEEEEMLLEEIPLKSEEAELDLKLAASTDQLLPMREEIWKHLPMQQ